MKILLVNNGSKYLPKLKRLVRPSKIIGWEKLTPVSFHNFDLVVLSGGYLSVLMHPKEFKKELSLIKSTSKPLIGICLGSELIAHAFGSKLVRMKRREHQKLLITEHGAKFKVYENHKWAIKKVSNKLKAIAKSRDGIEIFRHRQKQIFGLQFHPEVLTTKTDGAKILKTILKQIKNT